MSVSDYFSTFCSNLRMSSDTVSTIQYRYHQITKRINLDYWNSSSETTHSLYVGSYGRGTEIWTSDIDIIVQLPYSIHTKVMDSQRCYRKLRESCKRLIVHHM